MLQNIGIEKAWLCTHSQNENEPNARNKNLLRINKCNGVNFGVVTKFKFRYSIVKFLLVWLNQLTGLHPLLDDRNDIQSVKSASSIFHSRLNTCFLPSLEGNNKRRNTNKHKHTTHFFCVSRRMSLVNLGASVWLNVQRNLWISDTYGS